MISIMRDKYVSRYLVRDSGAHQQMGTHCTCVCDNVFRFTCNNVSAILFVKNSHRSCAQGKKLSLPVLKCSNEVGKI